MLRNISGAFTGGALGALLDSFNIWFMGVVGISDIIGITMKPEFAAPWAYKRMIWGGIWMLLLLLPVMKKRIFLRGVLFSLAPSAMMLFMVLIWFALYYGGRKGKAKGNEEMHGLYDFMKDTLGVD